MVIFKNISKLILASALFITSSMAMDTIRMPFSERDEAYSIYSKTFGTKNIDIYSKAFSTKEIDQIFDTLIQEIGTSLENHQKDRNYQDLFYYLIDYTSHRLVNYTSPYSKGKRWLTGQSNTLLVLGVLKDVTTKLGMSFDDNLLNGQVNEHLKGLKFYCGYLDYGAPGFNLDKGEFSNLTDNFYYYPLCIATVQKIQSHPDLIVWRTLGRVSKTIGSLLS